LNVGPQCAGKLVAAGYAEFSVGAAEVHLDRLARQEQLLADLAVRTPGGGALRYAALARGERPGP
jgi:hypothetical protein